MEPPSFTLPTNRTFDVAIVGAGPVGLAIAIELSQLGLAVVVLDRRPPLEQDTRAPPQLLVARIGDLAHLAQLGVDVRDDKLVSLLAIRTERDFASGTVVSEEIRWLSRWFDRPDQLHALARSPCAPSDHRSSRRRSRTMTASRRREPGCSPRPRGATSPGMRRVRGRSRGSRSEASPLKTNYFAKLAAYFIHEIDRFGETSSSGITGPGD